MNRSTFGSLLLLSALGALGACNANSPQGNNGGNSGNGGTSSGGTSSGGTSGGGSAGTGIITDTGVAGSSGGCDFTDPTDTVDHDGDGWSNADGDCNDCDPTMNPGAFDGVDPGDGGQIDNDCDGNVNNDVATCDDGIALVDGTGTNGAKAIDICRSTTANATGKDKTWGVISANYVMANGNSGMNSLSRGIQTSFGAANVQLGSSMLALSSGTARYSGQQGYSSPQGADMNTTGACPAGYPKGGPACGIAGNVCNDQAGLELQIRVPTNALSFHFNLLFFTYEFPEYVCSPYNDFYITWMDPKPDNVPDNNISYDQDGNSIGVNASFLQVCNAQTANGHVYDCPLGTALLAGTGFDETAEEGPHGATGWLQTTAPVVPGSTITLRFAIWDTTDHLLDSTVLIDNFRWDIEPSTNPHTDPVPTPK